MRLLTILLLSLSATAATAQMPPKPRSFMHLTICSDVQIKPVETQA